jgi:galactokinase
VTVDRVALRAAVLAAFPAAGTDPDAVRLVRAPGRINLIGEHTDYNDGFVLPMAIDREVVIGFVPADDRRVVLRRLDTGEEAAFDLDGVERPRGEWIDYIAGMAAVLARRGVPTRGLRGAVASTLPIAVGLSSSAALEIAAAWALTGGERPPLDGFELARAGQEVERDFIGVNSGLMDQLAAVLGRRDGALLIDCRSLEHRPVALPLERHAVVAIDSGETRRLGGSAYNQRRAECEAVVAAVAEHQPGVSSLRDVRLEMLDAVRDRVTESALRRATHVINENERVLACVAAFDRGDVAAVGELLAASHTSLRDLFEVSSAALDTLVEIACGVPGVVGARMTGAGFGGSIVSLVTRDAVAALESAVETHYEPRAGLRATVHVVEPADGAGPADADA